jgi:hypothetical protein
LTQIILPLAARYYGRQRELAEQRQIATEGCSLESLKTLDKNGKSESA